VFKIHSSKLESLLSPDDTSNSVVLVNALFLFKKKGEKSKVGYKLYDALRNLMIQSYGQGDNSIHQ
jgi:hypothetical protein